MSTPRAIWRIIVHTPDDYDDQEFNFASQITFDKARVYAQHNNIPHTPVGRIEVDYWLDWKLYCDTISMWERQTRSGRFNSAGT